jgi:hypothetical protein
MKWNAIQNQRRNGLYSRLLRLRKTILTFSKVDNFHRVLPLVEGFRQFMLGFNANRATGMIEYSFVHFLISFFGLNHSGVSRMTTQRCSKIQNSERGHFLVSGAQSGVNH